MGTPKGAPVSPPSTISSTALMYDELSEARKSTALAGSSGSPHRASGTVEEKKSETFADSFAVALALTPRFQMGVFVAPGATTFTRILRGARSLRRWIAPSRRVPPDDAVVVLPDRVLTLSNHERQVTSSAGIGPPSVRRHPRSREDYFEAPDGGWNDARESRRPGGGQIDRHGERIDGGKLRATCGTWDDAVRGSSRQGRSAARESRRPCDRVFARRAGNSGVKSWRPAEAGDNSARQGDPRNPAAPRPPPPHVRLSRCRTC